MTDTPALVSVIVPAYNGQKTILKTLQSVFRQNYKCLQLIVVDDSSIDSTSSLVEGFMKEKHDSIMFKLVKHTDNVGLSKTLNAGLREAKAEYVLILHQDCELIGEDWIERAIRLFVDDDVAVVTGYYGIPDPQDESFVKMAFGVLRKQFHSQLEVTFEETTFSEGKCDLYRKSLLLKIEGFPTNYRIAGEDLIVSYKLRRLGYKIIKSYDLKVVQRFCGVAESFIGNLKKEFLFGKVMGGVLSEFRLFLFKNVKSSSYSRSRSLHRFSQPIFVLVIMAFSTLSLFTWWAAYSLLLLLLFRVSYYFFRVFAELKICRNPVGHPLVETLATVPIGVLTDFIYSFGFAYGLIRYSMGKKL